MAAAVGAIRGQRFMPLDSASSGPCCGRGLASSEATVAEQRMGSSATAHAVHRAAGVR